MSACPENWKDVLFFVQGWKRTRRVILFTVWHPTFNLKLWLSHCGLGFPLLTVIWRSFLYDDKENLLRVSFVMCQYLSNPHAVCFLLCSCAFCSLQAGKRTFFVTLKKQKPIKTKRKKVSVPNLKVKKSLLRIALILPKHFQNVSYLGTCLTA